MNSRISKVAVTAVAVGLVLAGCGSATKKTGNIAPVAAKSGASAPCQAVQVGPFTRCENFYKDYWPTIDANLQKLYTQAQAIDGGQLVIWDWYQQSPDVVAAFHQRFPNIKVVSRGLTYNVSSAIISAKATGARNSDIVSGSITSMTDMYNQGFWQKIDWTKYGVPKEFLKIGAPELLPDSFNGSLIQYNTKEVPSVPTSLDDFTAPEWKGKLAVPNYDAQDFSGYGMKNGQAAMVSLIKKLKSSGNLAVVDDTSSLVSSGDKPVAFAGQLFNPNANLSVAPFDADNLYAQFSGLNTDATNSPAAILWILWNAYDPTWLTQRLTDPKFATSSMPYVGLPSSTFAQATGLIKKNIDAWTSAISSGNAEFETQATRDQWNTMIKAADKALNG